MKALVLGTAGLQINIPIDSFPYEYSSITFMDDRVVMDIAGVGYSHCLIFGKLGDSPTLLTGIGNDMFASVIEKAISNTGAEYIIDRKNKESLVSVILYDQNGKRSIIREGRSDYMYKMKAETYKNLKDDYDVAVFSMAGFSKDILPLIKKKGIPIACDIQDSENLFNVYGKDFMEYSDIIFFSDDNYEGDIIKLTEHLYNQYGFKIIGVGMGAEGCVLCVEGKSAHYPALPVKAVNTVGAGDAFFACFLHCYFNGDSPEDAICKAQIFAAEKIRYKTASQGFMDERELEEKFRSEKETRT